MVRFSGIESGELTVDAVVNSAGLGAQALARRTDDYPEQRVPRIVLARGNYFGYAGRPVFSRLVYPAPRIDGGLGAHVTLDLAGRMRFGPDVEWIEEENYNVNPERAQLFYASIRRYWPGLPDNSLQPDYAGIRPKLTGPGEPAADFMIEGPASTACRTDASVRIEMPGLTASLSLAEDVVGYLFKLNAAVIIVARPRCAPRRFPNHVRYWHKADMPSALHMSAFGGKADMASCTATCPLLTQSGHSI